MFKYLILIFSFSIVSLSAQVTESFDGAIFPPSNWQEFHTGANALHDTSSRFYSPTKSALFDDDFGVDTSWLVSPLVNVQNGTNLNFWQNQNYESFYVYHAIWISTTGANPSSNTFVKLDSIPAGTEDVWENKSIDLSQFAGQNIYVAFVYVGDFADEWHIDNVLIDTGVSQICSEPTSLFSTVVTASSIGLSWSPVGGEQFWKIEYGISGFTRGTGTSLTRATTNATINGLSANTLYDFYVTAFCSPIDSSLTSAQISVKTNCASTGGSVQTFTQSFDFETEPNLPCNWTNFNGNGDNIEWETSSENPSNGSLSAYLTYSALGTPQDDWLFSPEVLVLDTAEFYKLTFSYASRSGSAFPEKMEVVRAFANDGSQLQEVIFRDTAILTGNVYVTKEYLFKFPVVGQQYIGFHVFSDANQWDFMLDDISLTKQGYVGVTEQLLNKQINIYPNPANNLVTIQSQSAIVSCEVYTINGVLVYTKRFNGKHITINLNGLEKGSYLVKIQQGASITTKRIIKL